MRTEPAIRTPAIRTEDLIGAPPVGGPPRRPARWPFVALFIVAALFLASAGVAVWQTTELAERDDEVATLTAARDTAVAETAAATERVDALVARVDRLEARLAATAGEEEQLAARLDDSLAELDRMVGPALADGRHFGFLAAVGAAQEPPRVVFDLAQWFTGDDAVEAAIEDGRLPPGATAIENDYFIRNEDPRWRLVTVDPTAGVSLTVYPFGDIETPRVVGFRAFEQLFEWNRHGAIRGFPYWLTVEEGTVIAIDQQFVP